MNLSDIFTYFIVGCLGFWLLASAICQFNILRLETFFRRMDYFSLLPRWSFFAPNPGVTDYHLLYRDKDKENECGRWKELPIASKRTLLGAIWNPKKRSKKALSDAVQTIVRSSDKLKASEFKTSICYIALVNFISSFPRKEDGNTTQFMIMESYGHFPDKGPKMLFRSEFHKI
ncbi:hypothetical protein [Dokdonia sp.]|uniref:hypothetical protein n=1 Tax=Dokdonia sp. TaxID=2024995 RepID=UPI003265B953